MTESFLVIKYSKNNLLEYASYQMVDLALCVCIHMWYMFFAGCTIKYVSLCVCEHMVQGVGVWGQHLSSLQSFLFESPGFIEWAG